MLYQKYDLELDDELLTDDGRITRCRKSIDLIVKRVRGSEFSSVPGPQSSEEDIVVS